MATRKVARLNDDGSIAIEIGNNREATVEYRARFGETEMFATVRWASLGEVLPARAEEFVQSVREAVLYARALEAKEISPALLYKRINKGKE